METITVNGVEYKILGFRQIANGDTYLCGDQVRHAPSLNPVPVGKERLILKRFHPLYRPATREDAENRVWCYVSDSPLTDANVGTRATLLSLGSFTESYPFTAILEGQTETTDWRYCQIPNDPPQPGLDRVTIDLDRVTIDLVRDKLVRWNMHASTVGAGSIIHEVIKDMEAILASLQSA